MSTKIPWSTTVSNGGSYTGVPSTNFMCNQSMKKPRKVSLESSKPQQSAGINGSSEGSMKDGDLEDEISTAASRY